MIKIPAAAPAAMVVKFAGHQAGWERERLAGGWPDEAIRTPSHPNVSPPDWPMQGVLTAQRIPGPIGWVAIHCGLDTKTKI